MEDFTRPPFHPAPLSSERIYMNGGNSNQAPQYQVAMQSGSQGYGYYNYMQAPDYSQKSMQAPDYGYYQTRETPPPTKRRKVDGVSEAQSTYDGKLACDEDECSVTSSCCSSCSEGVPCAEPDCNIQKQILIPCTKDSCASSVCPDDACFSVGMQIRQEDAIIPSSDRTSHWVTTPNPWNQQALRATQHPHATFERHEPIDSMLNQALVSLPITSNSRSRGRMQPNSQAANKTDFASFPQYVDDMPHATYPDTSDLTLAGTGTILTQQSFPASGYYMPDNGSINCGWDECAQLFFDQEEFQTHLHRDHVDPQMTFGCPVPLSECPVKLVSNPLTHLQTAHGFNPNNNNYQCPAVHCPPQTFCNPADLHYHLDVVHGTPTLGSLQCGWNQCGNVFTDQLELLNHLPNHFPTPEPTEEKEKGGDDQAAHVRENSPQYPATIPDEVLTTAKHTCKWKFEGGICGVQTLSEGELQEHIRTIHLSPLDIKTGYFCQWDNCDRNKSAAVKGKPAGFNQRQKLERHMATHTLYKNSECPVCKKTFSAKQALKQHMYIHTGEKPWKCKYPGCGKAFAQQSAHTMHERTHTGEKPLKCEICGKTFSESSNLTKHRKIHGIVGNHPCTFPGCERKFYRTDQLSKHLQKHKDNPTGYDSSGGASSVYSTPAPESVAGGEDHG